MALVKMKDREHLLHMALVKKKTRELLSSMALVKMRNRAFVIYGPGEKEKQSFCHLWPW